MLKDLQGDEMPEEHKTLNINGVMNKVIGGKNE